MPKDRLDKLESYVESISDRKSVRYEEIIEFTKEVKGFSVSEVMDFLEGHDIKVIGKDSRFKPKKLKYSDPVFTYLQEMGKVRILDRDEELKIAYKMKDSLNGLRSLITSNILTLQLFYDLIQDIRHDRFPLDEFVGYEREREFPEEQKTDFYFLIERIETNIPILTQAIKEHYYKPSEDNFNKVNFLKDLVSKDIVSFGPSVKALQKIEPLYTKLINEYDKAVASKNDIEGIIQKDLSEIADIYRDFRNNKQDISKLKKDLGIPIDQLKKMLFMGYKSFRILKKIESLCFPNMDVVIEDVRNRAQLWKNYDRSRTDLIEGNVRFVINVAKNHLGRGLDFLDLIQEGNQALVKAVERFDPSKGFKLGTYAIWWIRQAMSRAIASQGKIMKLPPHKIREIQQFKQIQSDIKQKEGRFPSQRELAQKMNVSEDKIKALMSYDVAQISLDKTIGSDDERTLVEIIEDESFPSPMQIVSQGFLKDELKNILETLTDKEKRIIILRYGLEDSYPRTLEEIGEIFNLSRERIRQIETKALEKLRTPSRLKKLMPYLKDFSK